MNKLRIVIIEDEPVTARNLAGMLQATDDTIEIAAMLAGVEDAVAWFTANEKAYDLIFMDIRLADGLSFDIFKQVVILKPVIFATAYNNYAITAFKNNGIDYILKPFDEAEVAAALEKFKRWVQPAVSVTPLPIAQLMEQLGNMARPYKKSFLVHFRDKLIPVEAAKIAWFNTANELVYAQTMDNAHYNIEQTMEQLEQQLEPALFYRANRQYIVNRKAIVEVDFYFNGRLSLKVKPEPSERILISKARVPDFKRWMDS